MNKFTVALTSGLSAVAILALIAAPAAAQNDERIGIARGSTPEPVVIENLDGESVNLGDYYGRKPVLVQFWATWCEQCEALHPRLVEAYDKYSDRVEFLAVGVGVGQSPRSIRRHLRRHPMPYEVLWDSKGAAVRAFMTPATSHIVILDQAGQVAYTGIGPDQDIDAAIRTVIEH